MSGKLRQRLHSTSMLWNSTKAKVQLRLSVQRLRTLQQKKEAQAKVNRRDIATLIEKGKLETARIKIETIINEDIHVELMELLELYCELLLARFGLLDLNSREPDPGIAEGVCSIIHSAPRTELKELHILREILMHKYGREFSLSVMENRDECVPRRVISKLVTAAPASELVDAYLTEIAKAYGVPWSAGSDSESQASKEKTSEDQEKHEGPSDATGPTESGNVDASDKPGHAVNASPQPEDDFESLAERFAALKKR